MKEAEQKKESEVEKTGDTCKTTAVCKCHTSPDLLLHQVISVPLVVCLVPPSPMIPKSKEEAGVDPIRNVLVLPIQISLLNGLVEEQEHWFKAKTTERWWYAKLSGPDGEEHKAAEKARSFEYYYNK